MAAGSGFDTRIEAFNKLNVEAKRILTQGRGGHELQSLVRLIDTQARSVNTERNSFDYSVRSPFMSYAQTVRAVLPAIETLAKTEGLQEEISSFSASAKALATLQLGQSSGRVGGL